MDIVYTALAVFGHPFLGLNVTDIAKFWQIVFKWAILIGAYLSIIPRKASAGTAFIYGFTRVPKNASRRNFRQRHI